MKCVVYMLRKDTRIWWDAVKKTRDVTVMAWAKSLIEFNSKYYSQAIIYSKVAEFTRLQKWSMSVLNMSDNLINYRDIHPTWFKLKRVKSGDSRADFVLV